MRDLVPTTGRVHWIGTGMSTGSGINLVAEESHLFLWGRSVEKADSRTKQTGIEGRAEVRRFSYPALADELGIGDLVVSMVPAGEHPKLLRLALIAGAHFVCASYLSDEVAALAAEAADRGLVVLTEVGLDPGIDHVLSHQLVRKARAALGDGPATVRFTSFCGSNPAVPNEFRYRFNWAPRGVLTALLTSARFVDDSAEVVVDRPWERLRTEVVNGEEFEVYPNRDSIPFIETYDFPEAWEVERFVRGTLRLRGWSSAWEPVLAELPTAGDQRITELARELAERYPGSSEDIDRVVMAVSLEVDQPGQSWGGSYRLDVTGTSLESATPRLVSVSVAWAVLEIVRRLVPPGLHQATTGDGSVDRSLAFLSTVGVEPVYEGN